MYVFNLLRKPQIQRLQVSSVIQTSVSLISTLAVKLRAVNNSCVHLFSGPKFVFNQPKQSGDFQFGFASKSPQKDNKDNELPFPFNF